MPTQAKWLFLGLLFESEHQLFILLHHFFYFKWQALCIMYMVFYGLKEKIKTVFSIALLYIYDDFDWMLIFSILS